MTTAILSFLVGFVAGCALILILGICLSATRADLLAERMLGPGSSDDLQLGLLVALDEANSPPAERRRM